MPGVSTTIGVRIHVSAGLPATLDATGYGALTFTEVGEVTSLGDRGGSAEDVSYTPLATGVTVHLKGARDLAELPIEAILDSGDAGQALMQTAFESPDLHSFKLVLPDGAIDYFQARVFSAAKAAGDASALLRVTYNLRQQPGTLVEVAAP